MDKYQLIKLYLLFLIIVGIFLGFSTAFYLALSIWIVFSYLKYNGKLPKKDLKGEHVFITGGAMGIGKELSKRLLKLGSKVTVVDINLEEAQKAKKEFQSQGLNDFQVFQCDVTDRQNVENVINQSIKTFGEVDILVNNAGISLGNTIRDKSVDLMNKVYNINFVSHLYTTKAVLESMYKRNHGHIVSMGSAASYARGLGIGDYHATKRGVLGFHESLVQEFKYYRSNLKATLICPWLVNTNMTSFMSRKDILNLETTVDRIIVAIQQDEDSVVIPWKLNIFKFLHEFLPYDFYYALLSKTEENGYKVLMEDVKKSDKKHK